MWNAFTATLEELTRQYEKIRAVQEKKRKILVALDMRRIFSRVRWSGLRRIDSRISPTLRRRRRA